MALLIALYRPVLANQKTECNERQAIRRVQLKLETINLSYLSELCNFLQQNLAVQKMENVCD